MTGKLLWLLHCLFETFTAVEGRNNQRVYRVVSSDARSSESTVTRRLIALRSWLHKDGTRLEYR